MRRRSSRAQTACPPAFPRSGCRVEPLQRRRVLVGDRTGRPPRTRRHRPKPRPNVRGSRLSAAGVQDFPPNTSVCGTSRMSLCPPTITSLSPTTAAPPRPGHAGERKFFHFPSRKPNALFDASAMMSVVHHRRRPSHRGRLPLSRDAGVSAAAAGSATLPSAGRSSPPFGASHPRAYHPRSRVFRRAPSTPSSAPRSAHPVATAIPRAGSPRCQLQGFADDVTWPSPTPVDPPIAYTSSHGGDRHAVARSTHVRQAIPRCVIEIECDHALEDLPRRRAARRHQPSIGVRHTEVATSPCGSSGRLVHVSAAGSYVSTVARSEVPFVPPRT